MKTSNNNIENVTVNYRIEIVRDFNNVYYVNMTADNGEYVKGLPEYIGYKELKKAVKCFTGCELPTLKSLTFEGNGRKQYAHIERTGHQTPKALQPTPAISECRCDEITLYTSSEKLEAAHKEQKRTFGQAFDAAYYKDVLVSLTEKKKAFHFGTPADTVRLEVMRECEGYWRISMKRGESAYVEGMSNYFDWETILNTDRAAHLLSDLRADHTRAHRFKLGDLVRVNDEQWGQVNGHTGRITKMELHNQLVGTRYTVEFIGELPTYRNGQQMKENNFEPLDIEPAA